MDNLVPSVPYRRNLMSRTKLLDNSDWSENELKCREKFFLRERTPPLSKDLKKPPLAHLRVSPTFKTELKHF